jgi:hypothetical protein
MNPPRTVAVNLCDRRAYPWMAGIVLARPGQIVEDEGSGVRVRVRDDGSLEELIPSGYPRGGAAYEPSSVAGVRHGR